MQSLFTKWMSLIHFGVGHFQLLMPEKLQAVWRARIYTKPFLPPREHSAKQRRKKRKGKKKEGGGEVANQTEVIKSSTLLLRELVRTRSNEF